MKRTFAIILAALAAAALFAGLVHAVLVAAHVSEPAATTVYGLTPRRLWATTAAVLALVGVVIGGLALARPASRFGTASGRLGAIVALVVGPIAVVNRRAESGHRQRWSRHRQRSSRWRSGVRAGADRHGPRRAGSGPLPPHRLRAGANDVSSTSAMSNPAASFEPYRRRLLGLAYRMLGSMADAEDAVQETYLRWHGADRDKVSDPRAFLMTTTTRICLDMLTSARARREEYVGPWLPEPVVDTAALAPDSRTELAEDLSIALLLTLDRLSPLERAAFLLHDVFDFSFSEVATALERSEAACRQLAARARAHVRAARPRGATAPPARSGEIDAKHAQLMSAFAAATQSGDLNALTQLLASDVRVVTDGGGKVRAALNVIDGADRVARFLVDVTRKRPGAWWRDDFTLRFATINGLPGVIVDAPEGPVQTAAFEIEGDVIRALYVVRNPDKLRHLAAVISSRRCLRYDAGMPHPSWNDSYASGAPPPWDTGTPDPMLVEMIESRAIAPGCTLEVGCGTGTNAIYLAQHGAIARDSIISTSIRWACIPMAAVLRT